MTIRKCISLLLGLAFALPAQAYHIMLDPGHGGVDKGAVHHSIHESDLVLKVALKLKNLLEQNPDFRVTITRKTDHNIPLPERVRMAEKAQADLFVSLHANAALDPRARGVEFFFQNSLPPDEESLFLANLENQTLSVTGDSDSSTEPSKKNDVAAILEDLHRQSRLQSSLLLTQILTDIWDLESPGGASIKQAPFYVISKTSMPSVLIEIGFLSNRHEAKKLLSADYQNRLAQKIYNALVSYKKVDKREARTLN